MTTSRPVRSALAAALATLLLPVAAEAAQGVASRFSDLEALGIIEPGAKVWITFACTATGDEREVEGTVVAISDVSVTVDSDEIPRGSTDLAVNRVGGKGSIEIPVERVRSIKVYRKARRWGTLIGGAVGMSIGFAVAAEWERNETDCLQCYALFGGLFGVAGMGGGWVIDLLRDQRPIIYSNAVNATMSQRSPRLTFSPQISRHRKGLLFSLTW